MVELEQRDDDKAEPTWKGSAFVTSGMLSMQAKHDAQTWDRLARQTQAEEGWSEQESTKVGGQPQPQDQGHSFQDPCAAWDPKWGEHAHMLRSIAKLQPLLLCAFTLTY